VPHRKHLSGFLKKETIMQPKPIYDKNKSLAVAWAHKQPDGHRCTIFYAKAGAK